MLDASINISQTAQRRKQAIKVTNKFGDNNPKLARSQLLLPFGIRIVAI